RRRHVCDRRAKDQVLMAVVTSIPIGPAVVPSAIPDQLSVETTVQQERDLAQPGGARADEFGGAPELGFWRLAVIRFLHHLVATGALIILGIIVLSAIVVPIITGDLYRIQDYRHPFKPPFQR